MCVCMIYCRFNSYFEGAAAVVHHRNDLMEFINHLDHPNLKIESVMRDLQDDKLLIFVCIMAVIYIRPLMRYSST